LSPLVVALRDELVEVIDADLGSVARDPKVDRIEHGDTDLLVEVY